MEMARLLTCSEREKQTLMAAVTTELKVLVKAVGKGELKELEAKR